MTAASIKNVEFTLDPLPETFDTMGRWAADLGLAPPSPDLKGLINATLIDRAAVQAPSATTAAATSAPTSP